MEQEIKDISIKLIQEAMPHIKGIENATNSIADVLHKFPVAILEEDMIMLDMEMILIV